MQFNNSRRTPCTPRQRAGGIPSAPRRAQCAMATAVEEHKPGGSDRHRRAADRECHDSDAAASPVRLAVRASAGRPGPGGESGVEACGVPAGGWAMYWRERAAPLTLGTVGMDGSAGSALRAPGCDDQCAFASVPRPLSPARDSGSMPRGSGGSAAAQPRRRPTRRTRMRHR